MMWCGPLINAALVLFFPSHDETQNETKTLGALGLMMNDYRTGLLGSIMEIWNVWDSCMVVNPCIMKLDTRDRTSHM